MIIIIIKWIMRFEWKKDEKAQLQRSINWNKKINVCDYFKHQKGEQNY